MPPLQLLSTSEMEAKVEAKSLNVEVTKQALTKKAYLDLQLETLEREAIATTSEGSYHLSPIVNLIMANIKKL